LTVSIDGSPVDYERILSAYATPDAVFATTYDELKDLTNASPLTLRVQS
jgi:hypothetical protein